MLKLISQYAGLRHENYIISFGRLVTSLGSMVFPMLTLILKQRMGADAELIGLILAVTGFLHIPADLAGGRLADHYSRKSVIIGLDILSVVCYLIGTVIPLSWISIGLVIAAAIGQDMEQPAYNALIADVNRTEERDRAFSLTYMAHNLGLALAPTLSGILFQHWLWLSFLLSGVSIACSTVLIFLKIGKIQPVREAVSGADYQKARDKDSTLHVLARNRTLILYMAVMGFYTAAYSQCAYLMPLDLAEVHGDVSAVIYGTMMSLNCILVVVLTPFLMLILRRWSSPLRTTFGVGMLFIGFPIFAECIGHLPAYYLTMVLITIGEVASMTAVGTYLTSRVPSSHRGRILGVNSVSSKIFQSLSQILIGAVYSGSGRGASWAAATAMAGMGTALGIVLTGADRKAYPEYYRNRV